MQQDSEHGLGAAATHSVYGLLSYAGLHVWLCMYVRLVVLYGHALTPKTQQQQPQPQQQHPRTNTYRVGT